ncbi:unnamed protein product [Lactuca virosa]|uniref:Uncharacterized protein n=1 Tax=Lactuca virosa TaxID=75947 RepID=A0AAU9LD71_9ASTR|nr:unnamed protein product [Lactuca virosa]
MENFTRSLSRSLSSSVDANRVWRRTTHGGFDGGRSMRTIYLGEDNHGRFSKIKKMFNFIGSKKNGKDASKARPSSKISSSNDEFQSRLLVEIYKNMSSIHELGST